MESVTQGTKADPSKFTSNELRIYLTEISVMAKYASEQGKNLAKDDLAARIDKCLMALNESLADPTRLLSGSVTFRDVLEVHSQLSRIIKPVTFTSLDSTKPGFLNLNHTIKLIILLTSFSLLVLILMLFFGETISSEGNLFRLFKYLKIFVASSLGAGVYCLWSARRYIIDRTYDPRYNPTYIMRIILGIALGSILGLFGDQLFENKDTEIARLSQTVLAIIGGFSSDAVVSILVRLADTLKALVVGSAKEEIKAEADKARIKEKNSASTLLLDVKNKIVSAGMGDDEKKKLTESIDEYINEK